jgi:uracil-DNA glycosylase
MPSIVLVGEAWGEYEEREGKPFVGPAGYLLNSMLRSAGINREECLVTNVFNLRPRGGNDVSNLCGPKSEGIPGTGPLVKGKYVRAEFAPELARLYRELEAARPNVIIAFGATASWALCGTTGIKKFRGAPLHSKFGKVLPTWHPAAIMRQYTLRPVGIADLRKARRESEYPEIRRPKREIWVEPNLEDLATFERQYIEPSPDLSVDIETIADQITCIGFAPRPDIGLVIPFYDPTQPDGNYWRTKREEMSAWDFVSRWCRLRKRFVFQNGLYDMGFLWRSYGISVPGATDDTMLMHHAQQPEMEKGLAFLGSIYTDEAAWKFLRPKHETVKRED